MDEGDVIDEKRKIIAFSICLLLIIFASFTSFEFFVLKLLGLQYDSLLSLALFFILYLVLQAPILLIVKALPKALKSVGGLPSCNGIFTFLLYFATTFLFIMLLDAIMTGIAISWQSVACFALLSAIVNAAFNKGED